MSLSFLFWSTVIIGMVSFWWQSDKVKSLAMRIVLQYCRQQQLQLLDQTMVLKGVWPQRGEDGGVRLRRRYAFEFTSTGEERYAGKITLIGHKLLDIELAPHIIPGQPDQLH